MRAVISAGGTGGHIYPALAIINKIKSNEPNSEFLYIGTHNRMEKDIIPNHHIPYLEIKVYGFNRKQVLKNIMGLWYLIVAFFKARKEINKFKPDIVIGVGGYVTFPVMLAAKTLGIKTFIHEQNSVPGASNKLLSYFVDKIAVSFKSSIEYFNEDKVVFTGNPCSEEAISNEAITKEKLGLSTDKKLVYIVMGSLGSSKISEILIGVLPLFKNKKYEVLFITGKDSYDDVNKEEYPSNVRIFSYIENQTRAMKNADLVITRCGATTLSEIIALEKPSILIPSPYVPNNHQYKNGMDLVNVDAALMIEEKDLNGQLLIDKIDSLINDDELLFKMKTNLHKMQIKDSSIKIYKTLKGMIKDESN